MTDKEIALKYLNKNFIANINIIDPLIRGTAEILAVSDNGVLAYEKIGELFLLSSETPEEGIRLLEGLDKAGIFNANRNAPVEYMMKKYGFNICVECFQCAYMKGKEVIIATDLDIRLAKEENLKLIYETYRKETEEGLREIWERGELFCAYKEGKMVGFAGVHLEGSVGLLEIFPEYRGKGYGAAMEAHVINYMVRNGRVPWGHVITDNELSLKIQKRIGYEFSPENMFWLVYRPTCE